MIKFKTMARKSPKDKTVVKYYVTAVRSGEVDLDTIAGEISRECSLTAHDVKSAVMMIEEQLIDALMQNRSVRFKDLGSFRIAASSRGVERADDVSLSQLKGLKVKFCKGSKMKHAIHVNNPALKLSAQ